MMRIALIGPTYPFRGGIAHYTTLLFQALKQHHEIAFYSFRRQYPKLLFPGKTDLDNSHQPLQVECEYLIDSLNPLTWRYTAYQILDFAPDILLLAWWHPYWAFVWLYLAEKAKQRNIKVTYVVHNVVSHETKLWDKWLTRIVLSRANKLIVHSDEEKQRLKDLLPKSTVQVIPHPTYAPLSQYSQSYSQNEARLQLNLLPNQPVMLFFGFVRPYKGLNVLLESLTQLKNLSVQLLVVGEFWVSAKETLDFIKQYHLTTQVRIINQYVPNEAIGQYFIASDVVILPYLRASGSGIIQLAYGFGKPVIATNVGGLNDVVLNEQTGLLIPPNDSVALATAVRRFFTDLQNKDWQSEVLAQNKIYSWELLIQEITEG
jgi:glycosyltransferase involved in cell wall biosynthesis